MLLIRDHDDPDADFIALVAEVTRYRQVLIRLSQMAADKKTPVTRRLIAIIEEIETALWEGDNE